MALKLRQLLRGPRFLSFLGMEGCWEKKENGLVSFRFLESMGFMKMYSDMDLNHDVR